MPLSPAQIEALRTTADGDVFYKPRWGRVFGIRNDTFDALERRGLVEVLERDLNPGATEISRRWAVVLTSAGREVLDEVLAEEAK